jgi:ubiquitin-like modifier-activating enzyme ATG7
MNVLFSQPRSSAEPSFWIAVGGHKLNVVRLGEQSIPVVGRMGIEGRPGELRDDRFGDRDGASGAAAAAAAAAAEAPTSVPAVEPRVRLDEDSLALIGGDGEQDQKKKSESDEPSQRQRQRTFVRNECLYVPTHIKCLNLLETFKSINKNAFLDKSAEALLRTCGAAASNGEDPDADTSTDVDDDLSHLLTTVCLSHLDLKKHVYLYWFAFPSIIPRKGRAIQYAAAPDADADIGQTSLIEAWGIDAVKALRREYHRLRLRRLARCMGAAKRCTPNDISNTTNYGAPPFFLIVGDGNEGGSSSSLRCVELSKKSYEDLSDSDKEAAVFGFFDTSACTARSAPGSVGNQGYAPVGWSLRNMVAYLSLRLNLAGREVKVVSYRPAVLRRLDGDADIAASIDAAGSFIDESNDIVLEEDASLLLRIACPLESDYDWSDEQSSEQQQQQHPVYRTTGFEPNTRGRPGPRTVNLSPLLSPQHLAAQASDLNLRLMKWRAVPNLDLEVLRSLKVLLLGAGTLGCGVARTLQGWGVRDITLVDNGRVSYSNPARQNLFVLEDCVDGGKPKAAAAAESLKRIAGEANVKARGIHLTIPMPGHPFGSNEKAEESARKDSRTLADLIKYSDVVFLLTDTRESRWLPTVIARAEGKMLINAALGLDSWLVMRHGGEVVGGDRRGNTPLNRYSRLGCYFCNDCVSPENSTNNRTIDQQCTVTRPGIANIAASMAVELMVSLIHHPLGHAAPAPKSAIGDGSSTNADGAYRPVVEEGDPNASPLGLMPHQIRGSVASYTMMTPTVPAFTHCSGCSNAVVGAYRSRGFEFVKDVCNSIDGNLLDDISGLAAYRAQAESMMEAAMEDWDEDDDDEKEEG